MPRVDRDPAVLHGRSTTTAQFVEAAEIILALADDELRDVVVTPAGHLSTLLSLKTRAGYGHDTMSPTSVARSVRAVQHLAAAARAA